MSAASNYLENEVLDHVLGQGTRDFTSPANLYISLYTSNPDEDDSGTEVSGTNYARTAVAFNAASTGSATNNGDVTFPAAGAGGWGVVSHIGVHDASSAGNLLFYGALTASRTVSEADIFQISDTQLTISLA